MKQQACESDDSPPSNAEIKSEGSSASSLTYAFHTDKFTTYPADCGNRALDFRLGGTLALDRVIR